MASAELIEAVNCIDLMASDGMLPIDQYDNYIALAHIALNDEHDTEYGLNLTAKAKKYVRRLFEVQGTTVEIADAYRLQTGIEVQELDYWWRVILEESFYVFESFIAYMEKDRAFEKKFYAPRRYTKSGKPSLVLVARELQALEEGKYKFLGVSLPSRTGKSTICIFGLCWRALRHPNSHNAMGGHAGTLVKGFYKELLNFMTSSEYKFGEIYSYFWPNHDLIRDKSAEDFTITLDEPDRFATITCRGIDATWTGAIDVSSDGLLYVDDLVRDRQHSLSPIRMEETFQEYLNKMVDRKNDGAQELMVGTLWNVLDPLERLRRMYGDDPEYKFLRIPALDENDESNFDYVLHGFSTEYYKEMRSRLDNAEWQAKYQQQPYVREGLLFPVDEMRYFDGLVEIKAIKRVYAVIDPAVGGGDNVSTPICYELEDGRKLICRWVYDKRTIKFTVPKVVNALKTNGASEARIERNGVGQLFLDSTKRYLTENAIDGIRITSVGAPTRMSKEDKIKGYSDAIKGNYEFLAPYTPEPDEIPEGFIYFKRDADYQRAMEDMSMYTAEGKNVHDDSADSMAQMAIMDEKKSNGEVAAVHNPFRGGY